MRNKILIFATVISIILADLYVVFAGGDLSQSAFNWSFENSEGLKAGDDITVCADGLEGTHALVLTLYKDGRFVDLSLSEEKSVTLKLPNDFSEDNEWTCQAFAWDSLSTMKPLGKSLNKKIEVNADITDKFVDVNFLNAVRIFLGKNEGEAVYQSDVNNVTELNVTNKKIRSLAGIEYFTALKKLDCCDNYLAALNLSKNTELKELCCYFNDFQTLDFSENRKLELLDCSYNTDMTSLNVSQNKALKRLDCNYTGLTGLDISNNLNLTELICYGSDIEQLDLSNNTKLEVLNCYGNRLTSLVIPQNSKMIYLDCSYNLMNGTDAVKGWQDIGLILGETFEFYPQSTDIDVNNK